jgi:hypothetical protein
MANTILLHRKKETNSLYTINALNTLIKSLNNGFLDKNYMVDWNQLSDEEKNQIVNNPNSEEMMGEEEVSCPHCGGMGHDDMSGEECEWCMGTGVKNMEDFMEEDMYGPGDGQIDISVGWWIERSYKRCSFR